MKTKILIIPFFAGIMCLQPISSLGQTTANRITGNPYLPLWEHVPDGEPRVFEDPDNPGKYRVYITGSHDTQLSKYCGFDVHQWSAPVEDLNNWRDEGPVFTFATSNGSDVFFAPDLVEVPQKDGTKLYYLLPHDCTDKRKSWVASGKRPSGPFTPVNANKTGKKALPGGVLGFDPAAYVEAVDDPNDPDYETGYKAWGYWGFTSSAATRLAPDMWSAYSEDSVVKPFIPATNGDGTLKDPEGSVYSAIYADEKPENFGFFEASSMRKVGNKYVMIYSGRSGKEYGIGHSNSTLRYAYGDSPMGPWRNGGVLVDSRGVVLSKNGESLECRNYGHNTHGSIEQINGQWYVFYHRPTRGYGYSRQAMVAPIVIENDDKSVAAGGKLKIRAYDPYAGIWEARASDGNVYDGAEVTSEGFNIFGLPPYNYYPAGYACYLSNGQSMKDNYDVWADEMPIEARSGDIIGFKYFGFGGLSKPQKGLYPFEGTKKGNKTKLNLVLTPLSQKPFTISIWIDGPWNNDTWKGSKIGEITIDPATSSKGESIYTLDVAEYVDNLDKKHALFLRVKGDGEEPLFNFRGLGFSKKNQPISIPEIPVVSITADGQELALPTMPVAATAENGYTSNSHYHLSVRNTDKTKFPEFAASSSNKNVKFRIDKLSQDEVVVAANYNGIVKTYHITIE